MIHLDTNLEFLTEFLGNKAYYLWQSNDRAKDQYEKSSRPYVWTEDIVEYDSVLKTNVIIPHKINFYVGNAPAKIRKLEVLFTRSEDTLHYSFSGERKILFPKSAGPNWEWDMKLQQYEWQIEPKKTSFISPAFRYIFIEYSPLNSDQKYYYRVRHMCQSRNENWEILDEISN